MLNEAVALFRVERSRLPVLERAEATRSVTAYVKEHSSLPEEQSLWINAELVIYLAQSLYEQQDPVNGAAEFLRAKHLLADWCTLLGSQDIERLSPYLDIRLFEIRLLAHEDPVAYFNESIKLLDVMRAGCHTSTVVCFGHAISAAQTLYESGVSDPYRAHFFRLHQERELYQKNVQEDIRQLLSHQVRLFTDARRDIRDIAKALEWLDDFSEKNKNFNIPTQLVNLHQWRKGAWQRLGNSRKEREEEAILKALKGTEPGKLGVLVGVRKSDTVPSGTKVNVVDHKYISEFPLEIEDDNFFTEWFGVAGDSEATKEKAMSLALTWMLADLKTSDITYGEIDTLLSLQNGNKNDKDLVENLATMTPHTVYDDLYSQPNSDETFATADIWNSRFHTLKAWLEKPLKPSRNSRQHLLAVLQIIRMENVCHSTAPLSLQISEVQRCIDMVETLPPWVRDYVSIKIPQWHGTIADSCMLFSVRSKKFETEEVGEALIRAEQECKLSIELHEQKGDVVDSHMRRTAAADILILRIHWFLLQPGKSMTDPDLREIRETGLRYLEEAYTYFSSRHHEATLDYSLEGLEARERVNLVGNTWNIPQKAIQLLQAGDIEPDEKMRTQIWNWVQSSKARSLALTMGITGIIPSTLLHKISDSDKCRSMYEKMVLLQSRIPLSEPQARFWLRQELDSHLVEMRKEEQLQELCDLRDGKPLRYSEMNRIASLAGSAVVLVDWFHVPNTTHDGDLLLLIGKVGSAPMVMKLQISLEKVENWVHLYLDSSSAQHRVQQGQARIITSDLNGLVQPLTLHTKPGDVLVFCPTMKLFRVPLHAIKVELIDEDDDESYWEPIICRNPIVYSHSHSLLRICLWNFQAASEAKASLNPLILNGIRSSEGTHYYAKGRESVERLALDLLSKARLDDNATKSAFVKSAPDSRLIHVHSHVHWDIADPLAHSIDFTDAGILGTKEGKLTAQEIFALPLAKGSHVSLIACSGGLTQGDKRDEVFGLVPAFLRSGASSTISTLWKIPDQAGARFTEAFYRQLLSEKRKSSSPPQPPAEEGARGGFVDLARIFQRAVMEQARDETDKMLHWTSFVLHGFWMLYLP